MTRAVSLDRPKDLRSILSHIIPYTAIYTLCPVGSNTLQLLQTHLPARSHTPPMPFLCSSSLTTSSPRGSCRSICRPSDAYSSQTSTQPVPPPFRVGSPRAETRAVPVVEASNSSGLASALFGGARMERGRPLNRSNSRFRDRLPCTATVGRGLYRSTLSTTISDALSLRMQHSEIPKT